MLLGISWLGWIILGVAFLPVLILILIVGARLGYRSRRFLAVGLLLTFPFVAAISEAAWVEREWQALCATATTEIKRPVVVEGFYDNGFRTYGWDLLRNGKQGFHYVEWKDKQGRYWHSEGFDEPKLRTVQIAKPTARYWWNNPPFPVPVSHLIEKREETVVDSDSGEVIARKVTGYRYPSFVDRLWRQWFDGVPDRCEKPGEIYHETLIGVDRAEN